MSESEFDDVEIGDKIRFKFPHGNFEGEKTTGGVGDVSDEWITVKAGGYYQITSDDFVEIVEKGALL